MRQAIVTVHDEDGSALGLDGLLSAFEEAGLRNVEVLSCAGSRGVVRADLDAPIEEDRLSDHPAVVWVERVARSGDGVAYLVEFDASEPTNVTGACSEDVLVCDVADVSADGVTVDVAGPREAIRETVDAYDAAGATVTLEALREYEPEGSPLDALTDRQRDVLETAHRLGYFDVPREATTEAVAESLGLDDSTVAEHLQRAQRNLLSAIVAEA